MKDNLGGILSASFCFVEDIKHIAVLSSGIKLLFHPNRNWRDFPIIVGNTDISVREIYQSGVSLFQIEGKIRVSRKNFDDFLEMLPKGNNRVLLKFSTANGDTLVLGDCENPVVLTATILNPPAVSGFSGVEYSLSGTAKHPELPLL